MLKILKAYPTISAFASHGYTVDLPFGEESIHLTAISFVRNPLERLISLYFYYRDIPIRSHLIKYAHGHTLQEFIEYIYQANVQQYSMDRDIISQVSHLTNRNDEVGLLWIQKLIDEEKLLLFPLDRFNEACIALQALFPEYFRNCAYIRRKVSLKTPQSAILVERKIIPEIELDNTLYEIANRCLDSLFRHCGIDAIQLTERLNAFRRTCLIHSPKLLLSGGIRRVLHKSIRLIQTWEQVKV